MGLSCFALGLLGRGGALPKKPATASNSWCTTTVCWRGVAAFMIVATQADTAPIAALHRELGCNLVSEKDLHWHQQWIQHVRGTFSTWRCWATNCVGLRGFLLGRSTLLLGRSSRKEACNGMQFLDHLASLMH